MNREKKEYEKVAKSRRSGKSVTREKKNTWEWLGEGGGAWDKGGGEGGNTFVV